MLNHNQRRTVVTFIALLAAALYYAVGVLWLRAQRHQGAPSFDLYTSFYPNIAYALRSLRDGGGVLWNPYQNCGQPFFADSLTGLLYPTNIFFAFLDREAAVLAAVIINLLVGGVGMYALCREMRLGVTASVSGALVFQLGGTSSLLAAWTPTNIAVYAWMPVAMWRLERLLREPTFVNSTWLGIVLTLQLLPGYPQPMFFTYQLMVLRMGWALLTGDIRRPLTVLVLMVIGCGLPLFLAAMQVVPSVDLARASVRGLPLTVKELGHSYSWQGLRAALAGIQQPYPGNVITMATAVFCIVGVGRWRPANLAVFYLLVAVVYVLLSLGPNEFLYSYYADLPFGRTFRMPIRFLWVAGYAFAALSAFGVDALLERARTAPRTARTRMAVMLGVGIGLCFLLAPRAPTFVEWCTIATFALIAGLVRWGSYGVTLRVIVVLLVALNLAVASHSVVLGFRAGDIYDANADAFALLRARMTPQDRVALVGAHADLALMPKSASLFRVASIYDYAPQVSRSYGNFFTWLRTGGPMTSLSQWYYPLAGVLPKGFNQRLFNLTAARFVLIGRKVEGKTGRGAGWRVLHRNKRWTLYENPAALARARFVPRVVVAPEERVLPMLAAGSVDATEAAIVSQPLATQVDVAPPNADSEVRFVVDQPEHVEISLTAPVPGFLYLADQYAAGWQASVNGESAEILRANSTFRAVAVPAGQSEVVFQYRPRSFDVGASLSFATATLLVAVCLWNRNVERQPTRSSGQG